MAAKHPQIKTIELLIRLSALMGERSFESLDEILEFLGQNDSELYLFAKKNERFRQTVETFVRKADIKEV